MRSVLSLITLSFLPLAFGANPSSTYRVRQLERRIQSDNIYEHKENILTHSDDGGIKLLVPFLLDIFETPEEISHNGLSILRMAMNKFIQMEFNAIYSPDNNVLETVSSKILGPPVTIYPGKTNGKGLELMMEIKVLFDKEPSPHTDELNPHFREIMNDLSYFVTNLTAYRHDEFNDVTEAYWVELPTDSPTQAPTTKSFNDVIGPDQGQDEWYHSKTTIAIPSALLAASVVAVGVYLVARRRKRSDLENSKSEMMFIDSQSNLYSFDKSLESTRSPLGLYSSTDESSRSSLGISRSSIDDDSVYLGVESLPPLQKSRSAFTHASSATVPASNMNSGYRSRMSRPTQYSTVSDDESNDVPTRPGQPSFTENTRTSRGPSASIDAEATDAETTDVETTETETTDVESSKDEEVPKADQATSGRALTSLAAVAACSGITIPTKTQPKSLLAPSGRDTAERFGQTKEEKKDPPAYNPFQCNTQCSPKEPPTINLTPKPNEYQQRTADMTPLMRNLSREESIEYPETFGTPLMRNLSTDEDTGYPELRQTPNQLSTPTQERPMTPSQMRTPNQGMRTNNYVNDPQTSSTFMGYGCSPFGLLKKNTERKDSPCKTPNVIIEGLSNTIPCSSGRRHAGNNQDIDGSAMYQQNAMDVDRLDWSYKSVDEPSIGDSTISEPYAGILPKQVLDSKNSRQASPEAPIEKKIHDVSKQPTPREFPNNPPAVDTVDSLSYASDDNSVLKSPLSITTSPYHETVYSNKEESIMSSIVCRDCYAPPGKLNIVIHSTKDGPTVHSVKPGSSLEGHIFPGDLIIAVSIH